MEPFYRYLTIIILNSYTSLSEITFISKLNSFLVDDYA